LLYAQVAAGILRDKKELQKNLTGILSDEKICKKLS
jgi:hypothetical protein